MLPESCCPNAAIKSGKQGKLTGRPCLTLHIRGLREVQLQLVDIGPGVRLTSLDFHLTTAGYDVIILFLVKHA
jgi:hypothetical protein